MIVVDTPLVAILVREPAAEAFIRFGDGRHPAGLDVGACLACALAKDLDVPLLSKGDDVARTDIRPALA